MKRTHDVRVLCVRIFRHQNSTHFDEIWYEECPEINWVNLQWARINCVRPILHRTLNSKFSDPERASALKMETAGYPKCR